MATGATETGGSSTASEIGNLEMSTKSNVVPNLLPTSETGGSSTASETGNLEMSTKSNIVPNLLPTSETGGPSLVAERIRGADARSDPPKKNKNIMPTSEMRGPSTVAERIRGADARSYPPLKNKNIMPTSEPGDLPTASIKRNSLMSRIFGNFRNEEFSTWGWINAPDHLRKLDEQAFIPLLISIGPIHLSNAKLQAMKKVKVLFSDCLIEWANINLENLLESIKSMEKEIRSYYAQTIVSNISSDDFVIMIVVDGMFILEYFLRQSNPFPFRKDPKMIMEWMHPILKVDLVLLENQLPFFVLDMLFTEVQYMVKLDIKSRSFRELAFEFFQCYNFQKMDYNNIGAIEHFTDLVRLFYLGECTPQLPRIPGTQLQDDKLLCSATQLHEIGVKFEVVEIDEGCCKGRRNFLDIRFDVVNKVLEIPCIKLNAERVRLIRNIIALEQSLYVGEAYVTDFFVILDFLIDTSKDVDLLCDKRILVNDLGNSKAAASAVNNLNIRNTKIFGDYMNANYSEICCHLNEFYKQPRQRWRETWYGWKETLWLQYFSTPWRAASTSAAIILLVFTAIQTVCSLKSTKW